jgi:hypothetical protein
MVSVSPPEHARFRLFEGVATKLRNAARREPILLILDDLHAADRSSLLLLEFVARELTEARILVIGAYRDTEVRRHHPLSATLAELARSPHARRVVLRGLVLDESLGCSRSCRYRATGVPRGCCPPAYGGNPFFVTELVPLLPPNGGLGTPGRHAGTRSAPGRARPRRPSSDRLSSDCNRMLAVAAVIGRAFDARTLARIEAIHPDRLLALLEEALDARVVVDVPHTVGRYAFAHTLIREVLYDEVPAGRRVLLHRQIADELEAPAAGGRGGAPLPSGGARRGTARAVTASRRAGDHAAARLAYDEAAEHYSRALEALALDVGIDVGERCELLLSLGEARRSAGAVDASRTDFLAAADLARQLGSGERLAHAALGYGGDWFAAGRVDETLVALLDETLAALPEGDSALRARTLARLASELYSSRRKASGWRS